MKTLVYWEISQAYNRQEGPRKGLTTEKAINLLTDIEEHTIFKKEVRVKATSLLNEIIGEPDENSPRYFNNVVNTNTNTNRNGGDDAA
jgi:hypothetical protein